MKIIFVVTVVCISLCSCAAHNDANVHRNLVGLAVAGDEQYATVSHVRNEKDGQRLADKHCRQFGKAARFDRMEGARAIYNCRSPSL